MAILNRVVVSFIVISFFCLFVSPTDTELKSYTLPAAGAVLQEIQPEQLTLYASEADITFNVVINLPSIDTSKISTCKDNDVATLVKNEHAKFKQKLTSILGLDSSVEKTIDETKEAKPIDIPDCSTDDKCTIQPLIYSDGHTERPIPCPTVGKQKQFCGEAKIKANSQVYCCHTNGEDGCPDKIIPAMKMIKAYVTRNQRKKLPLSTNSALRSVTTIPTWCYIQTQATINGVVTQVATKNTSLRGRRRRALDKMVITNSTVNDIDTISTNRVRRSNLAYWASGGFLSSSYIDNEIGKVKDASNIELAELKTEIQKNAKASFEVLATKLNMDKLTLAICSMGGELTEAIIQATLKADLDEQIDKVDRTLTTCQSNVAPMVIPTDMLERLCVIHSADSSHCYQLNVRAYTTCAIDTVHFDQKKDTLHLALKSRMKIPLAEVFFGYQLHTAPVYIGSFKHAEAKTTQPTTKQATKEPDDSLKQIVKLLKRDRRDADIFKTTQLKVPDFIATKTELKNVDPDNSKVLAFTKKDCTQKNGLTICDVSGSSTHALCAKQLIATIQNPTNTALDYCLTETVVSYQSCKVTRTNNPDTLILSTAKPITIMALKTGDHSFFQRAPGGDTCGSVCLIREERQFKCEDNTYTTRSKQNIQIRNNDQTVLTQIDMASIREVNNQHDINPFRVSALDKYPAAARAKRTLELIYFICIRCLFTIR